MPRSINPTRQLVAAARAAIREQRGPLYLHYYGPHDLHWVRITKAAALELISEACHADGSIYPNIEQGPESDALTLSINDHAQLPAHELATLITHQQGVANHLIIECS